MHSSLIIREASRKDIPALVRHRRLMFEDMGQVDAARNDSMEVTVASYLTEALPNGEYRAWMATVPDGYLAASGGLKVIGLPGSPSNNSGRYSYVMSLYVDPRYRRQGIARQLIEEMIDWSRRQGIREVRLHYSDMGKSLYERMGFLPNREMKLLLED